MHNAAPVSQHTVVPVPSPADAIAAEAAAAQAQPALDADWPTLSVLSRRYIDRALSKTGGNKTRAADLLGIDRRTLNRILARERAKKSKSAVTQ
jgi:Fis family transcriptional regulator, factor for inversion stimulation protein